MPQSAIKFSPWLGRFLQRRGLTSPDQRGLYAYQCDHDEYIELLHLLTDLGGFDKVLADSAACACLVLFGSEWYRREYRSDFGWSWDPIWRVLGYNLSAMEINRAIPRGLERYWKRPLHLYDAGRRDFLGSVFSEGGLPFQVLREGGSRFQALFDRLLTNYDQCHLLGLSTALQVEQQLERVALPQVFSTPISVELVAQMVDELVALVRNYGLTLASEPVAHLDNMYPNWRASFPLPLDNETGSELLNSLLKTAADESKKRRRVATEWSCRHYWHEQSPNAINVQVSLPREVSLRLTSQPSTTRFDLAIVEDGRVIATLAPGYALVENGMARIRLSLREATGKRLDCRAQLSLVAMAGGIQIATLPIERSAVALGEVPLGFERINERWVLVGQASFNVTGHELMLVLPDQSEVTIVDSDSKSIFSDMPQAFSLRTVKAQGKAQILVTGDESYRIRTGHQASVESLLELVGKQIDWPTKPALTFIGLPRVQWPAGSGELQQQGGDLYVGGKLPGSGVLQETLGSQFISARSRDGNTLLRRRVGVLPTDFRIELRSGETPNQGYIRVFTRQRCLYDSADSSIQLKQARHEDYTELRLTAGEFPPVKVRLSVTPNLLSDPIVIELPFPGSGCLAYDSNGRKLKPALSVDDLLGARLFLFGRIGIPTRFCVELTLPGSVAKNAHYSWNYTVGEKPLEISLFNIKEQITDLLSLQAGIDQAVALRVFSNTDSANFRIRRYAMEMQLDHIQQQLRVDSSHWSLDALPEPVLMLLHDPMRTPLSLESRQTEGVPNAYFELPAIIENEGPWLVLPKNRSGFSFRPVFIPGNWQLAEESGEILSLQKAVLSFDHASELSSFTQVFDAMATNPSHSGWQFLKALYDDYGYLPLATFEVWKALLSHTSALAMALFKFEMDTKFLSRLESEFPIFWEFLPIGEIHLATEQFARFLESKGVSEQAVAGVIERMLSRLTEAYPTYGQNVQGYLLNSNLGAEVHLPNQIFSSILLGWYHELIRERSEATWPDFAGKRLAQWHGNQRDSAISLPSVMDYRNSVLYLPVFAAAVASGKTQLSDVFNDDVQAIFFLRQVRDFDSKWFNAVYQYCLMKNLMTQELL